MLYAQQAQEMLTEQMKGGIRPCCLVNTYVQVSLCVLQMGKGTSGLCPVQHQYDTVLHYRGTGRLVAWWHSMSPHMELGILFSLGGSGVVVLGWTSSVLHC